MHTWNSIDHGKSFSLIVDQSENSYLNGPNNEKVFDLDKTYGPFNSLKITSHYTHESQYTYYLRLKEFDVYGSFFERKFCECHSNARFW